MLPLIILFSIIGLMNADGSQEKRIIFAQIGNFDQCEGKDAANYTYIDQYTMDSSCTLNSNDESQIEYLIACSPNGQKVVNVMKILAESEYPAGAYYQAENLYLIHSGNLEGKYAYMKEIGLREAYMKKCSSVLGYSYVSTKSQVLLIAEKLDMNIFMNPGGAYEPFKRTATTICQGRSIIV